MISMKPIPESLWIKALSVPFLVVLGLIFIAAAIFERFQVWIEDSIGLGNFMFLGIGFLFFYVAVLVAEKNLMRKRFLGLLEEIQGYFLGPDFKQVSGAIDILIQALESDEEKAVQLALNQLQKMTGEEFGADPLQWQLWWEKNRVRFLMARNKTANSEGG